MAALAAVLASLPAASAQHPVAGRRAWSLQGPWSDVRERPDVAQAAVAP
eukprot:gene4329-57641_t